MRTLILFLALCTVLTATPLRYNGTGLTLRLLCDHECAIPGQEITVGLEIKHDEGYHTYWKNPGIIGFPMTLEWQLPPGATVRIDHPYPEKGMMSIHPCYTYQRDVILLSSIKIPETWKKSTFEAPVDLSWMCCSVGCCPDLHTFPFSIKVASTSKPSPYYERLRQARLEIPQPSPEISSRLLSQVDAPTIKVELSLPSDMQPVHLFSEDNQSSSNVEQSFSAISTHNGRTTYLIELPRYKFSPKGKTSAPFILQTSSGYFTVTATHDAT